MALPAKSDPELQAVKAASPAWKYALILAVCMLIAGTCEHLMGRLTFSASGAIRLWGGGPNSPENSQQFVDWYSFSHVMHGFLLYAVAYRFGRGKLTPPGRFSLGMLLETIWEILENSPLIVARDRRTITAGYSGDTVFNSMSDILCAAAGYCLAKRLPVWCVVALAILMEALTGFVVHDNLVLNVIMLLHPFAGIRRWQAGV